MNKEQLQIQIEEMKNKLAEMELELNKPEVTINYWQPKYRDKYYFVNHYGGISEGVRNINGSLNRVFKTREEAERYAEYVKAEETLRRVIAEANEGIVLDWKNFKENKFEVHLNAKTSELVVECMSIAKTLPSFMYIKSRQIAEKLIEEYEQEFRTYLSY